VIDFYSHEVLVPAGSVSIYLKLKDYVPEALSGKTFTLMFGQGRNSIAYQRIQQILDEYLEQKIRQQQWENVNIFRPT
jgi:hypothetical protein